MRARHPRLVLLLASLLALTAVACGDDDVETTADATSTTDPTGTTEATGPDDGTTSAPGDPADPCTLLTANDLESVLDVSISEPEDVSDRFSVGGPEVESHTCQWEATATGDGAFVSMYSVELLTVPDDADGEVYAGLVESAGLFDAEVSDLELGDEAVGVGDDGAPEIIVRRGGMLLKLSTASDDLTVDDLLPLAEAALGAVAAG